MVSDGLRETNAAGICQGLDPCGDVDAVTKDVVLLDDYVAKVDADTEFDTPVSRTTGIDFGHRALHCDRAAHRIDDAGELG